MNTVMKPNNKWSKEIFFILACVGAAVGLGNLWRFPYMAYQNGGGAFLIPFIICLFLVGIPIAMLEIGLGRWSGGSVAESFNKANKRWTWIGWWALINSMVIVFYYCVVLAWSVQYIVYSLTEAWAETPNAFFLSNILGISSGPFELGSLSLFGLIALFIVWLSIFFIVRSGTRGLSKVLMFTVPLPLILLIILAGRGLTLPGAGEGMSYLFTPRFDEILNLSVWAAAASQVVLSLGLGMGQMVAYASKKRDDAHVVKSGITICSMDLVFSILAGITVFSTMGFLAFSRGIPIEELNMQGLFLAFVSYPMAISSLPLAPLWGVLFFVLLVTLGIDSAFAVIEANLTGLEDLKPRLNRNSLALIMCIIGFLGGIIFTTGAGLFWLDIVDHWVAYYSIAAIIILQCLVFGNFAPISDIASRISQSWSGFISVVWRILISYVLPLALILVFGANFINEFTTVYGDYQFTAVAIGGWGVFLAALLVGFIFAIRHNQRKT